MKIHIERFTSNNPALTFDDVVHNISAGVTGKGTVNVHFETKDKYIEVDSNGSLCGPHYNGLILRLSPHLYSLDGSNRYLEPGEDEYFAHPEFWQAQLAVELDHLNYNSTVIALKHEYFVSYVPDHDVMNYDCLGPIDLIDHSI